MNTHYRNNLEAVMQVNKSYTDKEVKKAKDELITFFSRNTVDTDDHTNEPAYQITAPSGAKLLQLMSVGGNTVKLSPSVASDSTKAMIKTMPSTVYTFDGSKVYGVSTKYNQLASITSGSGTDASSSNVLAFDLSPSGVSVIGHIYLFALKLSVSDNTILHDLRVRRPFIARETPISASKQSYYFIGTATEVTSLQMQIVKNTGATSETYSYDTANVIDLTAIFGSGNEPNDVATAKTSLLALGINVDTNNPYSLGDIHNLELTSIRSESQNILPISDIAETTYNGITYKAVGGKIYAKRTSAYANNVEIYFARDISLTGSFNLFSNYSNSNMYYRTSENSYTSSVNQTRTNITIDRLSLVFGSEFNQTSYIELTPMFVYGSVAPTTYAPYVAPTTKTIDLSTILYNGSPLFEGNSLKGIGNVADEITPYKAIKRFGIVDLGSLDYVRTSAGTNYVFYATIENLVIKTNYGLSSNLLCSLYETKTVNGISAFGNEPDMSIACRINQNQIMIINNTYTTAEAFKTAMSGVYLVYELATPIEVSIDWSSTLRGITGYSNGTITLQNTYNMDVESVITYNSIIQETLCPSITITRNGVEVETRNLPTITSDGYGVNANAHNLRVFSDYEGNAVNKRYTNVNKNNDLGSSDWQYNATTNRERFYANINGIKVPVDNNSTTNILISDNYENVPYNTMANQGTDLIMAVGNTGNLIIRDFAYIDTTTFKNAMTNKLFYYELADSSKTETDIDDFDFFFDVEEGDVITFNNPYAQQVYATYSFIIKEAKSNE